MKNDQAGLRDQGIHTVGMSATKAREALENVGIRAPSIRIIKHFFSAKELWIGTDYARRFIRRPDFDHRIEEVKPKLKNGFFERPPARLSQRQSA